MIRNILYIMCKHTGFFLFLYSIHTLHHHYWPEKSRHFKRSLTVRSLGFSWQFNVISCGCSGAGITNRVVNSSSVTIYEQKATITRTKLRKCASCDSESFQSYWLGVVAVVLKGEVWNRWNLYFFAKFG